MAAYRLITPPAAEPISLTEAKLHLKVDDTADDALISSLIFAVREHVETICNRALITQTWECVFDKWPGKGTILLPRAPLQSVSSIKYYDVDGVEAAVDAGDYDVDTDSEPGRIALAYGKSWPSVTLRPSNAVRIRFVAGHATPFVATAATDTITPSGRVYADGDVLRLANSGGALPGGLADLTDYHVVSAGASSFKLAASAGGVAIDITGAGTGTHFIGALPKSITQAMLLILGHLYQNREAVNIGNIVNQIPMSAEALLAPWRVWMPEVA